MSYHIILHVTTACNFRCSYCDVVKDSRTMSDHLLSQILEFIRRDEKKIEGLKFFGGEPLLAFDAVRQVVGGCADVLGRRFEIVTNGSLLTHETAKYLQQHFRRVSVSVDQENRFAPQDIFDACKGGWLMESVCINLVATPGKHDMVRAQFFALYELGFRTFNILPVYFTLSWSQADLRGFAQVMKDILWVSLGDRKLILLWFQRNNGYNFSLANRSVFIDVEGTVYYSDIVSTSIGRGIKDKLTLCNIASLRLSDLDQVSLSSSDTVICELETENAKRVSGQREIRRLMDYFSTYLNQSTT